MCFSSTDVNECSNSQCDLASSECINTPGSFHCQCRKGFASNLECRPVTDLGLTTGGIPDEGITTSEDESGYNKNVCKLILLNIYYFIRNVGWINLEPFCICNCSLKHVLKMLHRKFNEITHFI